MTLDELKHLDPRDTGAVEALLAHAIEQTQAAADLAGQVNSLKDRVNALEAR